MVRCKRRRTIVFIVIILVITTVILYSFVDKKSSYDGTAGRRGDYAAFKNVSESPINEYFLPSENCLANYATSSQADIEMPDVYKKLEFNNVYGGAWTQGWNVQYSRNRWNFNNKLKVFVVPHSHNDPGWRKTFEEYYMSETRHILDNMVIKLLEDRRRKFIWAEVSYLSFWWEEISNDTKKKFKSLVDNGQIEIVTGGWVMTDEANSHYYSMIQQLTHGHQWLQTNLNITSKYSWCIDPFGVSPTMPFLLKSLGFEGLVIQRTHYEVKKYLAKHKQLEFRWRQFWDNNGEHDFFTHMMPFYSYDIPHTCGPDPKICCQFDFKRVSWFGLFCPWKVPPDTITSRNVVFKSELLLDQYRKKAELYSTNVLLVPLGDDFRYTTASEWDAQFDNYEKIFDYINSVPTLFVEAKFGTLKDYFEAVKAEKATSEFPSLAGDFFTYADRDNHYWSGYYTTRPFYKRMDRELIHYLRTAELIHAIAWKSVPLKESTWLITSKKLLDAMYDARSSLSLFQHHDGITGTARDHVVHDYSERLLRGIENMKNVIQISAQFLLTRNKLAFMTDESIIYFQFIDERRDPSRIPQDKIIKLEEGEVKKLVIFNSLTWRRKTSLYLKIEDFHNLKLVDSDNNEVPYQITPLCSLTLYTDCYTLHYEVDIKPLQLKTYYLKHSLHPFSWNRMASVNVYGSYGTNNIASHKKFRIHGKGLPAEFSIQSLKLSVAFNINGLLKAITIKESGVTVPVHLNFVKYVCQKGEEMCGAYLFLPNGEADTVDCNGPVVQVTEGLLVSQVTVHCNYVIHTVNIYNNSGTDDFGIEIKNLVDIRDQNNFELAMRISTNIQNEGTFYTDLNGHQIVKRQYYEKLPIQANFYPMASSAFIEDETTRLTLLSAQPLGASSLKHGQLEVMQDRILNQGDGLGLGQGIRDNKPTSHLFRLVLETRIRHCQAQSEDHNGGYLSSFSYLSLNALLYPLTHLVKTSNENVDLMNTYTLPSADNLNNIDIHIVSSTTIPGVSPAVGLIFHRSKLDTCFSTENIKLQHGEVNVTSYLPINSADAVYSSSLTFTAVGKQLKEMPLVQICPMGISAIYIQTNNEEKKSQNLST